MKLPGKWRDDELSSSVWSFIQIEEQAVMYDELTGESLSLDSSSSVIGVGYRRIRLGSPNDEASCNNKFVDDFACCFR